MLLALLVMLMVGLNTAIGFGLAVYLGFGPSLDRLPAISWKKLLPRKKAS